MTDKKYTIRCDCGKEMDVTFHVRHYIRMALSNALNDPDLYKLIVKDNHRIKGFKAIKKKYGVDNNGI